MMFVNNEEDRVVDTSNYNNPYYDAYIKAWEQRFQKEAVAATAEGAIASAAPITLAVSKPKYKKKKVILAIVLILAIAVLAFGALSYFEVIEDIGLIYDGQALNSIVDSTLNLIDGAEMDVLDIVAQVALYLTFVMALATVVVAIVALAVRKKLLVFIPALLMLIFALAAGGVYFAKVFSDFELIDIFDPSITTIGFQWGYYILVGIALISFIISLFSYKRIRR